MRAFGARGYVSDGQKKSMDAFLRQCRRAADDRLRAEIRALSNQDIQKIMARKIVEAATNRASVMRADFIQAGIPDHRIDKNRDAAFRLARTIEPKLDAIGAMPCAA